MKFSKAFNRITMFMMITLSKEEMLSEWKRRKGMIPVSTSTLQITRSDSQSVDEMLMTEIDDWYADILAHEAPELLPRRDFAGEVTVIDNGDGSVDIDLPDDCGRPVSVKMSGWRRPARIIEDSDSALARMQSSRYVSGKACDPIAVKRGRRLTLYSKCGEGTLTELLCVAAPADGSYVMERRLLMGIDRL